MNAPFDLRKPPYRVARARLSNGLRPGLAFMTFHFPDRIATNNLTVDAVDPKSGTSEFKATAVRIEPAGRNVAAAAEAAEPVSVQGA